jgi:hypothetical protein
MRRNAQIHNPSRVRNCSPHCHTPVTITRYFRQLTLPHNQRC